MAKRTEAGEPLHLGSVLAPILIGAGRRPAEAASAALASTFFTSVASVITFTILSIHQHGSVAPDWPAGIARRRPGSFNVMGNHGFEPYRVFKHIMAASPVSCASATQDTAEP